MSYSDFQAALTLAITHPEVARALKQGDEAALAGYTLSERERLRLRSLTGQRGMSLYCSLARANRLEAISEAFPMTLVVMEPVLREFLTDLWDRNPPSGYRFDREIELFSDAVGAGLDAEALPLRYLPEVFRYERACWMLAQSAQDASDGATLMAIVEFEHHPQQLLEPLSRLEAPPESLPPGRFQMEITLHQGRFTVRERRGGEPEDGAA